MTGTFSGEMTAGTATTPRVRGRRRAPRFAVVFRGATLLAFVAMALFSFASPLYAAPDEPVHVIKAAAVVRGQLVGRTTGASKEAFGLVTVPSTYGLPANRNSPTCFHRRPTVPASCAPALVSSATPIASWIYVARYPPLYYAIVGLPTLVSSGVWTIYAMRLVSALLSALFIGCAAAVATCYSRRRLALVGVVVATTPMVLFLGGVVNPSGLEVAAAISAWTAGSVLVCEHLDDPPRGLLVALGVSIVVLAFVRSLSPFWLALIGLSLAAIAGAGGLKRLWARPGVRLVCALGVVAAALASTWVLLEHSTAVYSRGGLGNVSELTILETSFAHNDFYLPTMVGVFGWFDTYAPTFTYVAWYAMVGALALFAAARARRRDALVLALLVAAILVVPVAISTSQVHRYGYTWSGRDTLPLAVGLPVLAAALLGRDGIGGRSGPLAARLAPLAAIAQFGAFFEALRRYAVGTRGPDFGFLLHPSWTPPGGFALLLCLEAAVLVAGVGAVSTGVRHGREPAPPADEGGSTGHLARDALA